MDYNPRFRRSILVKPVNMPMRVGSGPHKPYTKRDPINPVDAKNNIALLGRFDASKVGVRQVAYGTGRHTGRGLKYMPSAGFNSPSFST